MKSSKGKIWRQRPADRLSARRLENAGLPPFVSNILSSRGVSVAEDALAFWKPSIFDSPDPFLLSGMGEAVTRLVTALHGQESVVVWLDYDSDGITAGSTLMRYFRSIGLPADYYVPSRMDEGYGLNCEGIEALAKAGAKVIVSVDCGVTSIREAELARSLGVDLIITDHHTPGPTIPNAYAVIDPLLPGDQYPFKSLAGVGVAFNLLVAIDNTLASMGFYTNRQAPELEQYLDLVALGTVADLCPVTGVNRALIQHGLTELTHSDRPGIVALKEVSKITGEVRASHCGFSLGPRLNASGRLASAKAAVELLLTDDETVAKTLAQQLDELNSERREIEAIITEEMIRMIEETPGMKDRWCYVLACQGLHHGVIGICASRIVERYNKPTIIIGTEDGEGRGSCRSISALNLYDAIKKCEQHLVKFGGHRMAAGLSIKEADIPAFADAMEAAVRGMITEQDLVPYLDYDLELDVDELSFDLVDEIRSLEPFGIGNPEPVAVIKAAKVAGMRVMKEKHLKLTITITNGSVEAVGFNLVEYYSEELANDLAFTLDVNEWRGRQTIQLKLRDMR